MNRPTVAVIGAGLAGLSAAYHLKQKGIKASVFEARARPGGRVLTHYDGKHFLANYEGSPVDQLGPYCTGFGVFMRLFSMELTIRILHSLN